MEGKWTSQLWDKGKQKGIAIAKQKPFPGGKPASGTGWSELSRRNRHLKFGSAELERCSPAVWNSTEWDGQCGSGLRRGFSDFHRFLQVFFFAPIYPMRRK